MKILSMSGFIPEQICDTVRFTRYSGDRNLSHYCGYASDFMAQVIYDDTIDGAVYPKSCDSTRILTSYLSKCSKFLFQFHFPSAGVYGAEEYLAGTIRSYKEAVEKYYGIVIDNICERAEKINIRNKVIGQVYSDLSFVSYTSYLELIHRLLKLPLAEQRWRENIKKHVPTSKSVFIIGSFLSNIDIARMIEKIGLTVVGDTLPESGRLVSTPQVNLSKDIFQEIASSMLSMRLSPTQNSFRTILERDMEEIKQKSARGIIFVTQKYCEAYDYLYNAYKAAADALEIPVLHLTVNDTDDTRKVELMLEAFADML